MLKQSKAHLREVDETYFEHLSAALAMAGLLAKAGVACALHAVVPGLCTRTASRCVAQVSAKLVRRRVVTDGREPSQGMVITR